MITGDNVVLEQEGFPHIVLFKTGEVYNLNTKTYCKRHQRNGNIWYNVPTYCNSPYPTHKQLSTEMLLRKYFNRQDIIYRPYNIRTLNFIGFSMYEITIDGKVWNNSRYDFNVGSPASKDYIITKLKGDDGQIYSQRINRLVALAFIPNPNNLPEVNHIDGNKNNNHVSNLEWSTTYDNLKHARTLGLKPSAISDNQIHIACDLLNQGLPITEIANNLNVSYYSVANLKRGTHTEIVQQYNIEQNSQCNQY